MYSNNSQQAATAHTTIQQMTTELQDILQAAATTCIGHIAHKTSAAVHHRCSRLVNQVNRQYHRHVQTKTTVSHSRYIAAQDKLTSYMQQNSNRIYDKLMSDVSAAVSTFQHDTSVWWKLIERVNNI
jgi:hypothetical protein